MKVYHSLAEIPESEKVYVSVEEMEKNFAEEVAWAEKNYGPDVPRITPRGRPKNHAKTAKSLVKAVRLKESVWESLKTRAKEEHLTTNAALQLAILDWLERT